jgi:hypothetical protein
MFRPLRLDIGAEATADRLVERCEVVARDRLARTPILAQAVLVAIDLKRHHVISCFMHAKKLGSRRFVKPALRRRFCKFSDAWFVPLRSGPHDVGRRRSRTTHRSSPEAVSGANFAEWSATLL